MTPQDVAARYRPAGELERERVCPACRRPWALTDDDIAWFRTRDLQLPVRCVACRRARREGRPGRIRACATTTPPLDAPPFPSF